MTWSQVTNFPNVGNYAQDPSDTSGYASDNPKAREKYLAKLSGPLLDRIDLEQAGALAGDLARGSDPAALRRFSAGETAKGRE